MLPEGSSEARTSYELLHPAFDSGEPVSIELVGIAFVEEKLLVAVPHHAWDRRISKRLLPSKSLTKVSLFEVQFCLEADPSVPAGEELFRLWVGFLNPEFVARLLVGPAEEATATVVVETPEHGRLIPYAPALRDVHVG